MLKCNELVEGKNYACECCGLEIKIVKACTHNDQCDCEKEENCCDFTCCGKPMSAMS